MVFYRKYRPQLISELDLESVREKLTSILSSENIPHAFLFAGPKGLGKTSSARILAKAINCEQRLATNDSQLTANKKKSEASGQKPEAISIEPCNKCSACVSITNGSAVDVIEIDAASNRGIDEIRDLKERIKFSPSSLQKKIYIIDEVHMLTTEAFNALLKTLEEPPLHVMFILATTEMGKLPETITSRTFYVEFKKPSREEIARSLSRIVKGENLDIDESALEKIGELSDGAFRDGAKILEDIALQSNGKKITLETLERLYKTSSTEDAAKKIIDFTLQKNTKSALGVIQELTEANADFKNVIEKMADVLHGKLLDHVSKGKTEISSIQKFLTLLDEAYKNMKGTVIPSLPLEMAVIGYSLENVQEPIINNQIPKNDPIANNQNKKEPEKNLPEASSKKPVAASSDQETFRKLLDLINAENRLLAGLLRGSKLEMKEGKAVLKTQSPFHKEKLSEVKSREVIEKKLSEIIGASIAISIEN